MFVRLAAVEGAAIPELNEGQTVTFEIVTDDRTGELFAEDRAIPAIESETLETALRAKSRPVTRPSDVGAAWPTVFYSQYR